MQRDEHSPLRPAVNRRDLLRATGVVGGALVAGGMRLVHARQPSSRPLRVGLIGAGGRGSSALVQTLSVKDSNVQVTAVADAFPGAIQGALNAVKDMGDKVDVPEERRFVGLDAYKSVLDHCDMVILATPPGFRPFHFQAAVAAGKHVFMEKPVCVDSYGARLCLEAAKQADEKGLKVVVGLQRRYANHYRAALAKVREGAIGDIVAGQVYWNGNRPWYKNRQPGQTEMQYQVYNWYHFNWLCGDHICEQHVHNIDVANWFLDRLPETAYGVGGLQNREPGKPTEIYDHHTVNFAYPGGVRIASQCKQFPGGLGRVEEHFQGTKGMLFLDQGHARIVDLGGRDLGKSGGTEIAKSGGKEVWKYEGPNPDAYQVEHNELHEAIRTGKPLNNAVYGTTSSFSAVLGRLATYSGKEWRYDDALALDYRTMPEVVAWDAEPPVLPNKNGDYPPPMPATFKVVDVTKPGKA